MAFKGALALTFVTVFQAAMWGASGGRAASSKNRSSPAAHASPSFIISPSYGMPTGGTQVTAFLNEEASNLQINPYFVRCQFGDKLIPAQSFFAVPDSRGVSPALGVMCQAPAGPAKTSVVVRITLDGRHFVNGPKFTYRMDHTATT